jgi:predicted O-methyltransferase YrrM
MRRRSSICRSNSPPITRQGRANGKFGLIFADAWAGKYRLVDETLALLKPAGIYVVDDMLPQPNWPEGHGAKAAALIAMLEQRTDLTVTKLSWASGLVVAVKR